VNLGAFGERLLLDEGGDAGDDIHPVRRLHAADEVAGFGNRLLLHRDDANHRRPGRAELGLGGDGESKQ